MVRDDVVHTGPLFEAKRRALVAAGADGLHVVSDFDRTLTQRRHSTHGFVEASPLMPESSRAKAHALYQRFYPVECDVSVPHAEKVAAMVEWWRGANAAMVDGGLTRTLLREIVADTLRRNGGSVLRKGAADLFRICAAQRVPLTVLSAGVADVIEEVVRADSGFDLLAHSNAAVVVVANRVLWDGEHIAGFAEPLVHGMNKAELPVLPAVQKQLRSPARILLLGDSLSDARMADPMVAATEAATGTDGGPAVVLKIAWIGGDDEGQQSEDEAAIATYLREFDAVVTGDGSLQTALDIINEVVGEQRF